MARILITYYQFLIGDKKENLICYYEGLIKELNAYGNEVLRINMLDFHNDWKKITNREAILESIEKFVPELIITFNNQIDKKFIEITNCPIALFDADSVDLFANLDLIKKYNDRYFMVTSYEGWDDRYSQIGFTKNKVCNIHPATAIQREDLNKDKNISFIGTNFNFENHELANYIKNDDKKTIYKALLHFWNNNDYNYKSHLETFCKDRNFTLFDLHCIFDSRINVLNSVLDLGLNLYGSGWERLSTTNYALSSAFDREPKFSLKHNQDIYNSSLINLSISHPQTNGYAFPWRIYDIMASSGLLISTRADLLSKLTKGFVEIPMYDSPYDARDLCKKYLKEENLRYDLIAKSNEYIKEKGRWITNFQKIEDFLNIKLINEKSSDFEQVIIFEKVKKEKDYLKKRIKNITNGLFLMLINIPFFELFFNKKLKSKIYKSIEKNKRL